MQGRGGKVLIPFSLEGEGGSNERSSFETGEGFSPQTLTPCTETDPSSGGLRPPPSPTRGHKGRREEVPIHRHCEERCDEAIHASARADRWIASLRSQ